MSASIAYPEFVGLFERYNLSIWPLQLVGHLAGLIVLVLMLIRWKHSQTAVFAFLAVFWVFIGVVFHFMYLGSLYLPERTFAVLWGAQSALFAFSAIRSSGFLTRSTGWYAILGWLAIGYSLIGYPVLGFLLRGSVLRIAWFGGFPCPMALFTLAILVLAEGPLPKWLLIVPGFWAVGGLIPFLWGIREDLGLIILGVLIVGSIVVRDRRKRPKGQPVDVAARKPLPHSIEHHAAGRTAMQTPNSGENIPHGQFPRKSAGIGKRKSSCEVRLSAMGP
jgi:hypothetical protein